MKPYFRAGIDEFRRLIHEAEPLFAPPHDYMNLDHPLAPLMHKSVAGETVPRMAALRHALFLLDITEKALLELDETVAVSPEHREEVNFAAMTSLSCVSGILWVCGIDSLSSDVKIAA
jgi:hypothetical protein